MNATADRVRGAAAVGGGFLLALGALLPWMSLFAGLHQYAGVDGLYGRLILAGGVLVGAGGTLMYTRSNRFTRTLVGGLGLLLVAFAVWILIGLRATTRQLGDHPMLVARPGPGLFLALAGAVVAAAVLIPAGGGPRR